MAPFSRERFGFSSVAIIDPFFTLPLLVVFLSGLFRGTRSETLHKWGRIAIGWACLYLVCGWVLTVQAENAVRRELQGTEYQPLEVRAAPAVFFPLIRRVTTVDAQGLYRIGFRSVLFPQPIRWLSFQHEDDPRLAEVMSSPGGQIFHWIADGFVQCTVEEDRLILSDRRYGWISAPYQTPFLAIVELDDQGHPAEIIPTRADRGRLSVKKELAAGWDLLVGQSHVLEPDSGSVP